MHVLLVTLATVSTSDKYTARTRGRRFGGSYRRPKIYTSSRVAGSMAYANVNVHLTFATSLTDGHRDRRPMCAKVVRSRPPLEPPSHFCHPQPAPRPEVTGPRYCTFSWVPEPLGPSRIVPRPMVENTPYLLNLLPSAKLVGRGRSLSISGCFASGIFCLSGQNPHTLCGQTCRHTGVPAPHIHIQHPGHSSSVAPLRAACGANCSSAFCILRHYWGCHTSL